MIGRDNCLFYKPSLERERNLQLNVTNFSSSSLRKETSTFQWMVLGEVGMFGARVQSHVEGAASQGQGHVITQHLLTVVETAAALVWCTRPVTLWNVQVNKQTNKHTHFWMLFYRRSVHKAHCPSFSFLYNCQSQVWDTLTHTDSVYIKLKESR